MIDDEHIDVELSEGMKQRIASGALAISEDEAIANVKAMVVELCCGRFSDKERAALIRKLYAGEVDAAAMVTHEEFHWGNRPQNPPKFTQSLVSLLVENVGGMPGEDVIVQKMIQGVSPNFSEPYGIPVYAHALMRYASDDTHNPDPWVACRNDGRMNLEIDFSAPYNVNFISMTGDIRVLSGTLVNQLCEYKDLVQKHNRMNFPYPAIWYLLDEGAVLDPQWNDFIEVRRWNRDYKAEWQTQFDALKAAIANKDAAKVNELIADKVASRAFSLGEGKTICSPDFWGDYWDEGRAALLALPDWVQEKLAPEMSVMMIQSVPSSTVQNWGKTTDRISPTQQDKKR